LPLVARNCIYMTSCFLTSRRRFGAYSSRQVYTPQDVSYLLEYARLRGVRVILELDAPSHSGNGWQWGEAAGLGQLAVCVNQQPWRKYCIQPPCGQLNPTNPNLYRVLRDVYRDILDVFPVGEPLHMGGDEVSSKQRSSSANRHHEVKMCQWKCRHSSMHPVVGTRLRRMCNFTF
jgi:N-acetyl-beta-hexosaminidase